MLKKSWRKRLGLAVLAIAVVGPPLAFGLSNLFFMTPKGRSFVAARIQRTIQLETSLQGSTWSPWNGFTVYGLLIKQPAPLNKTISTPVLSAESIRIHPEWHALLNKKLVIRGVEIRKPHLTVAIELLSKIPSAQVGPAVATTQPDLAIVGQPPAGNPAASNVNPAQPPATTQQIDPAATKPAPAAPKAPAVVVNEPTVWVTFTDARLSIVSAMSKKALYRISSIDGGLPISGKNAGSELVLNGISVLGYSIPSAVKIPVKWQAPVLCFGVIDAGFFGVECKLEAKIGLTPGLPFIIGGVIPKQDGKEIVLSEALRAKIGSIAGQGLFQGHALAPGSWQGQALLQTLFVDAEFAGNKASFNQGQGLIAFQQGVLRCVDARIMGDDLSILGNAMALSDGRFASHLRIVAAPESLAAISSRIQTDSSLQLTPLSTPQRAALDMRVFGFPGKVFLQANPAAKAVLIK